MAEGFGAATLGVEEPYMRHLNLATFGLLLRLTVAWYLVQVLGTVVVGMVIGGLASPFFAGRAAGTDLAEGILMGGIGAGFMGGILLFPYTSGAMAIFATLAQVRAVSPGPLGATHRIRIQVPWTSGQAVEAVGSLLDALGATSVERQGSHLRARILPPEWTGRWRRRVQRDEIEVQVLEGALDVRMQPGSRLVYQALWVDRGRIYRRLEQLESLLSERLAAERRAEREVQVADAQAARLAQAELLLLRAQVEPHFLFNTLAHLRELVRVGDTAAALTMVDALANHARAATERIRQVNHRLSAEAASVETYLGLMCLRFGQRLSYSIEVPAELHEAEVPVGALLVPAENAVKHGIEPKRGDGTVHVEASRDGETLRLDILDDGAGLSSGPSRGTGLANLRQRLRLAHGDQAHLTVEGRDTGGVHVRIELPLAPASVL